MNWMHARQALFASEVFGDDIKKILPIINPNGSDSAMFDNTLELLVLAGRPLAHAMMMMIPEPWSNHESMDDDPTPVFPTITSSAAPKFSAGTTAQPKASKVPCGPSTPPVPSSPPAPSALPGRH
jgi:glutamate synthase domain-containing protein 1